MTIRYIYNTSGEYVAFIHGENLFSPECEWLGYIKKGNEVYNTQGNFLGYVNNDDRIVRNKSEFKRFKEFPRFRPMRPMRPARPMRRMRMPRLPYPYEDIFEK